MALRIPLCIFNRHIPVRKRVKWDGLHFVGQCRMCGRPICKHENGSWRKEAGRWKRRDAQGVPNVLAAPTLAETKIARSDASGGGIRLPS
jgi:hypothetical protein